MRTLLKRLSASAGYLAQAEIEFRPGLNCVIGARGTCKSTLVESIRFAFNADPERVQVLLGQKSDSSSLFNIIPTTLGEGSIRCDVYYPEQGSLYSVERDVHTATRVYHEGVKDHTESVTHQIEIYSQGDLQRIAEDELQRLTLIDRPNAATIERMRREQREIGALLASLGRKIRELRAQRELLRTQIRALPELRAELEALRSSRPELSNELDKERALFLRRQAALRAMSRGIAARDAAIEGISATEEHVNALKEALSQAKLQDLPEAEEAVRLLNQSAQLLESLVGSVNALKEIALEKAYKDLEITCEAQNETYYNLRKGEQAVNESLKKEDALKEQIEHLEGLQKELEELDIKLESELARRRELRSAFQERSDTIYRLRLAEVDEINARHSGRVILTLSQAAQRRGYVAEVQRLLQGSRLRGQDDLARDLAKALSPSALIDMVEAGDTSRLSKVLSRDNAQATRLMSFLLDNTAIYDLEGYIFEDKLDITMMDEGQPKPIQSLSKGQKATALLPLILRDAPYPLIFDQPEDDLDNRFIFHSLIRAVSELKQRRQLIFVTHNANIPVLGEAEAVIVMRMESPTRAAPPLIGSVDERKKEIVDLLEGGARAFQERQKRYQELLTAGKE